MKVALAKSLWGLFKSTGKVEYYLKYKEEVKKDGKNN